ncbi:MAG: bifunctional phosphoribosylaminoimidazolecarboxamide formyltransferase/IMP cyclohydrolase [Chitinophagales bacterium]
MSKPVRSALISVYYKDHLEPIARLLHQHNVTIYSTGGTLKFLQDLQIPVVAVDTLTGFPEILGGRVKTLHPKVFGGILARRNNETDVAQLETHQIPAIDLVIVDLYPFEETVAQGKSAEEIIEKIDIGGISLIRAAAKNFEHTLIVSSRSQYAALLQLLEQKNCASDLADRKTFAAKGFQQSAHYDAQIFNYFNQTENIPVFRQCFDAAKPLRYGENPHQSASYYGNLDEVFEILNGRELSYNNLVDVEASLNLIDEFTEPTVAIIKHTNSCGLASRNTIAEAYAAALACDPTSAFGGVIAANRNIDLATANALNSLFFEVLSAPSYNADALEVLKQKKNRILLKDCRTNTSRPAKVFKNVFGGVLEQDADRVSETRETFKSVTDKKPSNNELADLEFAIKAVKHLKSNGIALVKNKQLIGMGCGQTSRVDSLQSALKKAKEFGFDTSGAVMASEAFFPFPDCVQIAHNAGITAISQPGGSIKDQDSIDAANSNAQAMVLTGIRHFKH